MKAFASCWVSGVRSKRLREGGGRGLKSGDWRARSESAKRTERGMGDLPESEEGRRGERGVERVSSWSESHEGSEDGVVVVVVVVRVGMLTVGNGSVPSKRPA